MNKNRGQRRSAYYCAKAETSPFSKLRQRPCPHLSCAPPGAPFLSRQERGKECGLREALSAACSRRRADVLVVRLPPAIDSLDSLRDAPPSLKNSFRHAFTLEKQCFGYVLSKRSRCIGNFIANKSLLRFSQSENLSDCTSYSPEGGAENFVGSEAGRILKEGGFADSASLSRILAELLGGTRSSPPEAPSWRTDRAIAQRSSTSVR